MNKFLRIFLYGCTVWLIPFLIAIPFYSPEGRVLIEEHFFKSIMIVTGGCVGAFLLIRLFQNMSGRYIQEGCIIGAIWLLINWALDLIILVPMSGMSLTSYFGQIGLRYLMIPIMSIMAGYIAENTTRARSHKGLTP